MGAGSDRRKSVLRYLLIMLAALLAGCTSLPPGAVPVSQFELQRYLGRWYEIARLDHSFERGLSHVSAEYSLRDDGGVRVINRGYSAASKEWKQAEGKAYFVGKPDSGHLKVSFFGPFYGTYAVLELDQAGYQYSLVSGPDRSYLWILARTPTLPPEVQERLLAKAAALGFDTRQLLFVTHQPPPPAQ
jgi:apolipoprotein D and lipocalin family protein